jgi:hypothetical protein
MKRRRRFQFGNSQHNGGQPMQPQQQINLPMKDLAGFVFNVGALIAIDTSDYKPDEPTRVRVIILHLVGPVSHTFTGADADAAYVWYLQLTGQARIAQPGAQ